MEERIKQFKELSSEVTKISPALARSEQSVLLWLSQKDLWEPSGFRAEVARICREDHGSASSYRNRLLYYFDALLCVEASKAHRVEWRLRVLQKVLWGHDVSAEQPNEGKGGAPATHTGDNAAEDQNMADVYARRAYPHLDQANSIRQLCAIALAANDDGTLSERSLEKVLAKKDGYMAPYRRWRKWGYLDKGSDVSDDQKLQDLKKRICAFAENGVRP